MLFKHHQADGYQWGIWKIEESKYRLLSMLPEKEKTTYLHQTESIKSESRCMEWLAVRVLLYTLLGKTVEICYEPTGKPYLANDAANLSISHTKGYVAVIISKEHEVGIDIEQYGERVRKVAHKFVREDEYPDTPEKSISTESLLLIWSAKEVMFKCMNAQDVDFKEHLYVKLPQEDTGIIYAKEFRTTIQQEFSINNMRYIDFVMTWTVI